MNKMTSPDEDIEKLENFHPIGRNTKRGLLYGRKHNIFLKY